MVTHAANKSKSGNQTDTFPMLTKTQLIAFAALLAFVMVCSQLQVSNKLSFLLGSNLPILDSATRVASISTSSTIYSQKDPVHPLPKVFVVPIPSEWNRDLLDCHEQVLPIQLKCGKNYWECKEDRPQPNWFILEEDTQDAILRFQQVSSSNPFGPTEIVTDHNRTFQITPNHPRNKEGEYDADVYFHHMIEGYVGRVYDPNEADLFYVPVYWSRRLECHPNISSYKELDDHKHAIANIIADWIGQFPTRDGLTGPHFFTVAGGICSCPRDSKLESCWCNPLQSRPDLEGKIRVGAWETPVTSNRNTANVIMPYPAMIHGTTDWTVHQQRDLLVMAVFGKARAPCIQCGHCSENKNDYNGYQCTVGCLSLRGHLIDQMQAAKSPDVLLFSNGANWNPMQEVWPPRITQVLALMMTSNFCLQPAGDSPSRKSFFESLLAGCIPVVFRSDYIYMSQLPFSSMIPYHDMLLYIPEECVTEGRCNGAANGTMVDVLRSVPQAEILRRRQAINKWGRRLSFSVSNSSEGNGYNNVQDPDAFLSTLQEALRMSQPANGVMP